MREITKYDIDIYGLSAKQHVYEFESGEGFFEEMAQDIVTTGEFRVKLILDKTTDHIQLHFDIKGKVGLVCDRSLEEFEEPIAIQRTQILKFGEHNEELGGEIEMIQRSTPRINVAGYIYEFIVLALPVKKIHPAHRRPDEDDQEEESLVYTSATPSEQDGSEIPTDPRWEKLKGLNKK